MNQKAIERAIHDLLYKGLKVPKEDHNFKETPGRVARVYRELFTPQPIEFPVFDESFTDFVLFRGFEFHTLCPHHLLPVALTGSLAYMPGGKVVGLSKLGE